MNTTDGIWVPSYYRRRHPFLWARAAGGPKRIDWIVGVLLAVLVLGLVARARSPQREVAPSAALAVAATTAAQDTQGSDVSADRVAYVSQPSADTK
jgi:hypothetical protein